MNVEYFGVAKRGPRSKVYRLVGDDRFVLVSWSSIIDEAAVFWCDRDGRITDWLEVAAVRSPLRSRGDGDVLDFAGFKLVGKEW